MLVAACGGSHKDAPAQEPKAATGTGDPGAVCSCSDHPQSPGACSAVACKPDLVCGYPCGVDGCNSICMTRDQFEQSKSIP